MSLFAVVIFPSEQQSDILQRLHDIDSDPYQIIAQALYLIESELGAPEIAQQLGLDLPFLDPARPGPAKVAKLSEDDIAWIGKQSKTSLTEKVARPRRRISSEGGEVFSAETDGAEEYNPLAPPEPHD